MVPLARFLGLLTAVVTLSGGTVWAQDLPPATDAEAAPAETPPASRPKPRVATRPSTPLPVAPAGGLPAALAVPAPTHDTAPAPPACEKDLWKAARKRGRLGAMVHARRDGLVVDEVLPGTLAEREGLLAGDVFPGATLPSLQRRLAGVAADERIELGVTRGGQNITLPVLWSGPSSLPPKTWSRCVVGRLGAVTPGPNGSSIVGFALDGDARPPAVGRKARLWWVLDEPLKIGPVQFGRGVRIALGRVSALRHSLASMTLRLDASTGVFVQGEKISVPRTGQRAYFIYDGGALL